MITTGHWTSSVKMRAASAVTALSVVTTSMRMTCPVPATSRSRTLLPVQDDLGVLPVLHRGVLYVLVEGKWALLLMY